MSALRSAMSAIGNAEAVEPGPGRPAGTGSAHFAGAVAGLGAGEAERRRLTEADVAAIVRQEAAERPAQPGHDLVGRAHARHYTIHFYRATYIRAASVSLRCCRVHG